MTKLSSARWCELTDITILDPDGWNRTDENFLWKWENVLIDFDTFWDRMTNSTVHMSPGTAGTKEVTLDKALTRLDIQVQRRVEWDRENPQPPTTFQLNGWSGLQ